MLMWRYFQAVLLREKKHNSAEWNMQYATFCIRNGKGTWVAKSVERLTLAPVMISGSEALCSVGSLILPLPLCSHSLYSQINNIFKTNKTNKKLEDLLNT